jgi:hypothetical protein
MPTNPPLTEAENALLKAGGGYGSIQQAISNNETSLDAKGWGGMDPYAMGKGTPYPAQSLGYETFYPKTAYGRLGFNPFTDNYERYKTGTTKWEDFLDAQNASSQMMWGMTSFFGLGGGDQSTYAAARDYEKLVDIGSPVGKTDTFSWALKQYVQAGYTKAIITSIVAEELALAGLTAATRGKSAGVAWGKTVKNFNRLIKVGDGLGDVKKFEDMYDMSKIAKQTKNARRTVDDLQDVSAARSFWQKSRAMAGKAANYTGKKATQLGRTALPHAAGYVDAVKKGEYAMNGFANATHAFGAFWRENREFKLAFEEADLEKAFIEKDAMAQLTDKYRAENDGKNPTGPALDNIKELAGAAGSSGKIVNSFLIYGTNKIGFNSLFTRFAPKVASESVRASKYGKSFINKANVKKGTKGSIDFVPKGTGIKGAFGWNEMKYHMSNIKKSPLRAAKYLGRASLMGTTEGTQEYFQEVIQDAEIKRAVKSYGKTLDGNWLDYYSTSMKKFISPEGAEVFASGFFMGAFAGPHKFMINKAADSIHAGADYLSGNYKKNNQTAKDMQKRYESQTEKLNKMFQNPWSKDQALGALMKKRKQTEQGVARDKAVEDQDENSFNHIIDDQTLETVYNALNNDVFDTLIDQIEQMDQLTDDEVLSAFSEVLPEDSTPEEILEFKRNAANVIDNARYIEKIKKDTDKRYINPFTYGVGEKDNDTTFGVNPYFMHNAFEYTKKQIVKNHYSYKRTLERQEEILKVLVDNAPFWNKNKMGAPSDITVLFNETDLDNELSILKKELEVALQVAPADMTASQKRDLRFKQEKYNILSGRNVGAQGPKIKDGKPVVAKKKGIRELINDLRYEYRKDEFNEKIKADYKQKIEEGAIEGILGVGMPVTLHTKNGGKGVIIEVNANTYKVKKTDNNRVVTVLKTNVTLDQEAALEQLFEEDKAKTNEEGVVAELFDRYKEYMNMLAKNNNNQIDEAALKESFQKFLNFYALETDGENITQALNLLMNPKGFEASLRRRAAVEEHLWTNRKDIISESLKAAYEAKELNFLLQELASEHNAFILEEDVLKIQDPDFTLAELGGMDMTFYDKTNMKPIDKTSDRHRSVMGEVREYLDKRWEKEDAARTEYKVGDEIRPSDVVDEEIASKIKAANKENKKAILESEVTENTAKIKIGDELVTVKLKEVTKPEVTPVTPGTTATPVAKVKKKEITSETPFEEWESQDLKDEVELMFENYKANMLEREDLPQAAKDRIENETIDEWINSPAGKGRAAAAISKYNASIKKAETPVKPIIKTPPAAPPEKKDDTKPGERLIDQPIAEFEIPTEITNAIISGKATIMTLGLSAKETQGILKALQSRDSSITSMNEATPDKQTLVTVKVTNESGIAYDITLAYVAKQTPGLAANHTLELAMKLGLPTAPEGIYQHPVKVDDEITFYASSRDQADWMNNPASKQHVFLVSAQEAYEAPAKDEEVLYDEWIKEINTRLSEAKTISELDSIYDQIVSENEFNDVQLDAETLIAAKEKATSKIDLSPNAFTIGETYMLSDNLRKSGIKGDNIIGVVEAVSNDSVTFKFPYSNDAVIEVPSKNLASTVIRKTDSDMNEELAKKATELSEEEKAAAAESKGVADELIDDAAIKATLDQAENSTIDEVRSNFWDDTINKENC